MCVVDSMLGNLGQLGTSVEMQLAQIYGGEKINVSLLKVQQQDNCVDCGVFAIAFCTEFCFTGRKGILEAEFNLLKMRQHLLTCLENMELVPFPKIRRKLKLKKTKVVSRDYSISIDCGASCGYPNSYDDMVQCDSKKCLKWFHYKCADLSKATDSMLWVCDSCKE